MENVNYAAAGIGSNSTATRYPKWLASQRMIRPNASHPRLTPSGGKKTATRLARLHRCLADRAQPAEREVAQLQAHLRLAQGGKRVVQPLALNPRVNLLTRKNPPLGGGPW